MIFLKWLAGGAVAMQSAARADLIVVASWRSWVQEYGYMCSYRCPTKRSGVKQQPNQDKVGIVT
jgi:hypothetical protein